MTVRCEPFELTSARGTIRGEVRHPARVRGSVVICHGFKGFFRWGFFPYLIDRLTTAGLRTIAFNFSGSGVGPDLESFTEEEAFFRNTFGRELDDLAQVVDESSRRGWIAGRYGLFGHSRGGGIAVLHAAEASRVSALVTWAAIASVQRWSPEERRRWRERGYAEITNSRTGQVLRLGPAALDEVERRISRRLDIARAAARVRAPWLIVHGTADATVLVVEGERLADGARNAELLRLPGSGHTLDIAHPMSEPSPALEQATRRTVDFFRAHVL